MKNINFLVILLIILNSGCKILRQPQIENIKKVIHFCGEFKHGDQPSPDCDCTAEKKQDATGQIVTTPKYTYFDRFGNKYCNLNIKDPCATSGINQRSIVPGVNFTGSPNRTSSGGLFNLYISDIQNGLTTGFGNTSNAVFLDVLTQVFSDLDAMLVHPTSSCGIPFVPVNIEIQSIDSPGSGILGEASLYWENLGETNGILHNEVWKGICSGANDPNLWDGFIRINLGYSNWYTGYDGIVPVGKVDLYTVVLHEVLHAMGFASLVAQDGKSKRWVNGTPSNLYNIFDQNLKFEGTSPLNNAPLITNSGGYNTIYNTISNPTNDLRSGCQNPTPSGPDIKFSGGNNPLTYIYAPATWSNGSSLSHFQINCDGSPTSQFVMNASITPGVARRINPEETKALCDLGYKLSGTYGTPTLDVGGGSNPNIKSIPACGELLVAVDDDGPCCTTNKFTVQYCPGNTLTISPSDLTCNDVYSGTVNVIDFENVLTGAPMPFSGGNFVFTPLQFGEQIFRYRLQHSSGIYSNYAYVKIVTLLCPGSNCLNTSTCNIICNPEFDFVLGNCISTNCGFAGPFENTICMNGWHFMYGSPDPFTGICNQLPFSSGGKMHIYGKEVYSSAIKGLGETEAVFTNTQFSQGKTYISSIYLQHYNPIPGLTPPSDIAFSLLNSNTLNFNTNISIGSEIIPGNYPNTNIVSISNTLINTNWKQFVNCFTVPANYDIFSILATRPDGISGYSILDHVEIIEDKIEQIPNSYSVQCGQSQIIGDNLCTITNMNYSWWDVTNSGSPIQLTNGTTVLAGGVSIPGGNTNGSQIQVSPNQTTVYELRRKIISTNGFPIAMNNCDKNVQVTVNVNTNIVIQKNVTSGSSAVPGSTVQFQLTVTNSTGDNLTNVAVEDVLHPDLLAGTLSVTANSNVSHSVGINTINFNVLNLPDGTTETINYAVQLSPGTIQTSITNCAKVEYAGCFQEDCVVLNIGACACPGWPQSIPNGSTFPTTEIQVATNGDVYVTGGMDAPATIVNCGNTFNVNGPGGFLAKYNSCGKLIWIDALPIPGVDISLYESGGTTQVFLVGHWEAPPYGSFIARIDDNGTTHSLGWQHNMPGQNNVNAIDIDNSGNIYIIGGYRNSVNMPGGTTFSTTNDFAVFLAKYNGSGNHLWSQNIVNTSPVIPACGINARSLECKGIAVNGAGSIIYVLGSGQNATVDFSGCSLAITPNDPMFCTGGDIYIATYEGGGASYTCQWAEKIYGVGTNAPSGIACDKNSGNFYVAGWVTNTSTSVSGFSLPPLSGPPNDTRGHFIAKYNYTSGVGGAFQSVYRDDFTNQTQYTDHFEDVFWDKSNNLLYVTATQDEGGKPYLHKHSPNAISTPIWRIPQPTIDGTRGHSSVSTNGLSNGSGYREIFMTGNHDAGVVINVNTNSGIVPVSFPQAGIFILKIEDQGANGLIKE